MRMREGVEDADDDQEQGEPECDFDDSHKQQAGILYQFIYTI